MNNLIRTVAAIGSIALGLVIGSSWGHAASPCKGMDETTCKAHVVFAGIPACNWVAGRTKADGGTVKAYCRGSSKKVPEGLAPIAPAVEAKK